MGFVCLFDLFGCDCLGAISLMCLFITIGVVLIVEFLFYVLL